MWCHENPQIMLEHQNVFDYCSWCRGHCANWLSDSIRDGLVPAYLLCALSFFLAFFVCSPCPTLQQTAIWIKLHSYWNTTNSRHLRPWSMIFLSIVITVEIALVSRPNDCLSYFLPLASRTRFYVTMTNCMKKSHPDFAIWKTCRHT